MSNVNIEVFNIGRTMVDRQEVQRWLDHIGADQFDIPSEGVITDPALLIALAAKRCYMSFQPGLNVNVTKVRREMVDYIDNILASGHGSVLEHASYSFAVEGVSRVFTAEMNRHRAGWAISEGSLRFIRFDKDIPWWMPTSLVPQPGDDADLVDMKLRSQEVFMNAFRSQQDNYGYLMEIWNMNDSNHNFHYKKIVTSAMRRIIGMGVATGGIWTGNIRALRHVLTMRGDDAAEEEIFDVFAMKVGPMMFGDLEMGLIGKEPMLFGDFSKTETGALVPKYKKV